jgi:hypothetical protein
MDKAESHGVIKSKNYVASAHLSGQVVEMVDGLNSTRVLKYRAFKPFLVYLNFENPSGRVPH